MNGTQLNRLQLGLCIVLPVAAATTPLIAAPTPVDGNAPAISASSPVPMPRRQIVTGAGCYPGMLRTGAEAPNVQWKPPSVCEMPAQSEGYPKASDDECSRLRTCYARLASDLCLFNGPECQASFAIPAVPMDSPQCAAYLSLVPERVATWAAGRASYDIPKSCVR